MDSLLIILLAAVAGMVVGALWYSPVMFGPMWQRLTGMTGEGESMVRLMTLTFLATIVMAYVLSYVVSLLYIDTFVRGAEIGAWMWLGYVATTQLINGLYEKRPFSLYAINVMHHFVVLVIMGGILAMF